MADKESSSTDKNTLTVKILSPTQTLYDGEAYSVSSVNSLGKFDILPYHANFITLVQKNSIILRIEKKEGGKVGESAGSKFLHGMLGKNIEEVKYEFDLAIIFTKDNLVKIYTNIQPQF